MSSKKKRMKRPESCQFAEGKPNACTEKAVCKFGDHWFCKEHGDRGASRDTRTTKEKIMKSARCKCGVNTSFDILNPAVQDVSLSAIAHSLSLKCRYNGHTNEFYSVAQHCVLASLLCDPRYALDVLLHDAAEAYITDIPSPRKHLVKIDSKPVGEIEASVMSVIYKKLFLPKPTPEALEEIRVADERMIATETNVLFPGVDFGCVVDPYGWTPQWQSFMTGRCWCGVYKKFNLCSLLPWQAEGWFLARYYELAH